MRAKHPRPVMTNVPRAVRTSSSDGWPSIPPEAADQIRQLMPGLAEEMIAEIISSVAEYARPGDADYSRNVRLGVEEAVAGFADRIASRGMSRHAAIETFHRLGKAEAAEGRSLDALQAALRAGARVVLHRLTGAAQCGDAPLETLGMLGEALFVHLDEIAAASTAGYEEVRARASDEIERRRQRLLELLLAEPGAADAAIRAQARLAGWRLPRTLSVVVLTGHDDRRQLGPSLPGEVLMNLDHPQPRLIVPDPDGPGRRQMLERALAQFRAAVGPAVRPADASRSLRWAQEAIVLLTLGVLCDGPVVHCDDHLAELLMHRGRDLLERLMGLRLAPLSQVAPARQDALAETLLAWLETRSIPDVAARLHVHPQTVRYRMNQIRHMFGRELDDCDARFELELVLRSRHVKRRAV